MATVSRREFLAVTAAGAAAACRSRAPAVSLQAGRPRLPCGVQLGEVQGERAVVWSRSDRPARLWVEWSPHESGSGARREAGALATPDTDYTARLELHGLPPDQTVFLRVWFEALDGKSARGEEARAQLRTAPTRPRDVRLVWSGDTCGQGYGIDPARGGLRIFEAIRRLDPDFMIHCGDAVYADQPLSATLPLPDGTLFRNLLTPEKSKVAETLAEFRGQHRYNLQDEHLRGMAGAVPLLVQWDDHDLRNNWYPGQLLDDARYQEKDVSRLWTRARRAFCEYLPLPPATVAQALAGEAPRIYRAVPYGPLLEVFLIDERSYRGRNTDNRQPQAGADTAFLGRAQLDWLKAALAASRALWKVVASDMPLGLLVPDAATGPHVQEAWANGDGPPLGRELELAELLRHLKERAVRNVLFVTADVHYAAAHRYEPGALFAEFTPFWELIAGPLHAMGYGPNLLDPTLGPRVVWQGVPAGPPQPRAATLPGCCNFGALHIDGRTGVLRASWRDADGKILHEMEVQPERG